MILKKRLLQMLKTLPKIALILCILSVSMKVFVAEGNERRVRRNTTPGNISQEKHNVTKDVVTTKDDELRKVLELVVKSKLIKEVGLSEAKAEKVVTKRRRATEIRQNYTQKRQSMRVRLTELANSPDPDHMEIKAWFQELEEIQTNYRRDSEHIKKEIYEMLTPQERVKYIFSIETKYPNEVLEAIGSVKENRKIRRPQERGITAAERLGDRNRLERLRKR